MPEVERVMGWLARISPGEPQKRPAFELIRLVCFPQVLELNPIDDFCAMSSTPEGASLEVLSQEV
jgi:hypothetical protein